MHISYCLFFGLLCLPSGAVHHPPDDDLCQYTDFSILPVDLDFFVLDDKLATEDCKALRFDYQRQCPDINPNPGLPGRPSFKLEINFKDPLKYLEEIKSFCKSDPVKKNVKQFAQALVALTAETVNTATQTVSDNVSHTGTQTKNNPLDAVSSIAEEEECTIVQAISQVTEQLCSYERSFLVSNMWT